MSNVAVGKEASQQTGEIYFQTYQGLLRQKERIDRDILKLQGKFFKAISKQAKIPLIGGRAKYIPRRDNITTLAKAIRECMEPKKEMNMKDILKSLSKRGLYHTDSKYFYTMVNNKLNRDKLIKKTSRGIFVYKPRGRKKSTKGAAA